MTRRSGVLLVAIVVAQIGCVLGIAILAYSRHPSNHWSADIRWTYILAGLGLANGLVLLRKPEYRGRAIMAFFLSAVFFGLIYSADKFNVLVHYDRWIQRGMPPSPFAPKKTEKAFDLKV